MKRYIKEELREDPLYNYSRIHHYEEIDKMLDMTWTPRSYVAFSAATTGNNSLDDPPTMRGIRHLIHPAVSCRWCGEEYHAGKNGAYCRQCYGPREGGIYV